MLIGYMRVSKNDGSQKLDMQQDALLEEGIPLDRIYKDLASGRHDNRPGLQGCLKALREGDTLVVWKLDRLARNLKDLVNIVHGLSEQGIGFKILAGHGATIDTSTSNGKMIFGIFATLAEFERDLIAERTQAGLAAARARGRMGGRPRKMDKAALKIAMAAMSDRKTNVQELAKKLNVTPPSIYRYLSSDGTLKEPGQKLMDKIA